MDIGGRTMGQKSLWDFLQKRLSTGQTVTLVVVVDSSGSTPGKPGFKMAVGRDGGQRGTIGGGIMEHRLLERARALLAEADPRPQLVVQVHHKKAPPAIQSGMICAGTQHLVLCPLSPRDLEALRAIARAEREENAAALILSPAGLAYALGAPAVENRGFRESSAEDWRYVEALGPRDTVYVIGGGHVGLALCRVLATLDFRIVVFDDRPDVATLKENSYAHEKIVGPYERIDQWIREGDNAYVVIVTSGFLSDAVSLERLIGKRTRYLGLMGSKTKLRHIFEHVRARGVAADLCKKVHAPIGIAIGNRTPAEIAISIAAEIVKLRNSPPAAGPT